MGQTLPNSSLGRAAAIFLCLGSMAGIAARAISGETAVTLLSVISLLLAATCWNAPWDRWSKWALLSVVGATLLIKAAASLTSGMNPHTHGLHYAVLLMWAGVAFGRGIPLACALPVTASYLVPFWLGETLPAGVTAAMGVIPACVFTGEMAAWLSHRLRAAERISAGRAAKMGGLVDATLAMASCQEPEQVAQLAAIGAVDLYDADVALVLLEHEQNLALVAQHGLPLEGGDPSSDPAFARVLWDALRHPDGELEPDGAAVLRATLGFEEVKMLILSGSAEPRGVVIVGHVVAPQDADRVSDYVARTLATQAGLGLDRIQNARSLRDESLRDALTGLGNRRAAMLALESLQPGDVLALIDLDHFKRVNDSFGHAAGDRVLRMLGTFLRDSLRDPDGVFRIGGEEFLVVLSAASHNGTGAVRRLLERWRRLERVTTFSAGVAVNLDGEPAERTLGRADAALYEAKRAGRDRVASDADAEAEDGTEKPEEA